MQISLLLLPRLLNIHIKGTVAPFARRSHQRCSLKKDVPKIFANFTRKRLCWSFFLLKA